MAQYTYNEPTNREDLTDVVTNISPTQTPITSMIGKSKASATYHEFPEDVLARLQDVADLCNSVCHDGFPPGACAGGWLISG